MTTDREASVVVRSWLQDGATRIPDHVLDSVLADLPRVRQRRPRWRFAAPISSPARRIGLLAAAALGLLVLGSVALVAGWVRSPVFVDARPFPADTMQLDEARYVIDSPVRVSLDVPEGWYASEMTATWTELLDNPDVTTASLVFATVEAIDVNPCHGDSGLTGRIGPSGADLVAALTARPGLNLSAPSIAPIGGYPSTLLTVTVPSSPSFCPDGESSRIWALPDGAGIGNDQTARLWIVDLPSTRLVVLTRVGTDTKPGVVAQVDAIVRSIAIGSNAAPVTVETPAPSPAPSEAPWPKITVGRPMTGGAYYGLFSGFKYDLTGRPTRLPSVGAAALWVPDGWYGTPNGIASDGTTRPAGTLSWWTVASAYGDACRWGTSPQAAARGTGAKVEDIAQALTDAWASDGTPSADGDTRPRVIRSLPVNRFGYSFRLDVTIPAAMDPSICDEGEYRLWVDPDGRARTALPGETIRLWVADLSGVLVVVDAGLSPGAPDSVGTALDEAAEESLALFYPAPAP